MKELKYQFGLSICGYQFVLSQGHLYPSYNTLTDRLQYYKITNSVFKDLYEPMKEKKKSNAFAPLIVVVHC